MYLKKYLFIIYLSFCSVAGYSQHADSLVLLPGSDLTTAGNANVTLTSYFQLLKGDFIQQALSPIKIEHQDIYKVGAFAAITFGLMRADKAINRRALWANKNSGAVRNIAPEVTRFGGRYALFTMMGIGGASYLFKDEKLTNATLLASQAYLTSGIWVSVIKFVAGRERPSYYDPHTNENEGRWHGMLFQFKKNALGRKPDGGQYSSFPSGHAAAAFSIATVYATMYKDKPWVPWLAYSSASLISLSRIAESRHWSSDVLVSSVLGYLCGKQVVRNFHKLERLSAITRKKKNTLSYNINYINRTIMPELVLHFR